MQRYKGICYPIERSVQGLWNNGSDLNQIKSSLLTIIMTKPGERIFNPYFGCALNTLARKQPEFIIDEARMMIANAIKKWEKRIQLTDVQIVLIPTTGGNYDANIQVLFIDPVNLNEMQQLTLQIPLEGD